MPSIARLTCRASPCSVSGRRPRSAFGSTCRTRDRGPCGGWRRAGWGGVVGRGGGGGGWGVEGIWAFQLHSPRQADKLDGVAKWPAPAVTLGDGAMDLNRSHARGALRRRRRSWMIQNTHLEEGLSACNGRWATVDAQVRRGNAHAGHTAGSPGKCERRHPDGRDARGAEGEAGRGLSQHLHTVRRECGTEPE